MSVTYNVYDYQSVFVYAKLVEQRGGYFELFVSEFIPIFREFLATQKGNKIPLNFIFVMERLECYPDAFE